MNQPFKWRHFQGEIILWAVRWYCKYGISYRELEEMLKERGIDVDHTTIYRWVQHYAPELRKRLLWHTRPHLGGNWQVDETYIKVKGKWMYLYRAIDSRGRTIDFYLSQTRNTKAAKLFLGKALKAIKKYDHPRVINTDKAPAYGVAIQELKAEGKLSSKVEHRQVKCLNNKLEADHGKLKRLIKPTLGFKSRKTAYATLKGFETMRMLKKGQGQHFQIQEGIRGEVRLIESAFGLGPSILADTMDFLKEKISENPELALEMERRFGKQSA